MLREASDEIVAEEEAEGQLPEGSGCTEDISSCQHMPEMEKDTTRGGDNRAQDLGNQPPTGAATLVSTPSTCPYADLHLHRPPSG